jgi:hypothetical protein
LFAMSPKILLSFFIMDSGEEFAMLSSDMPMMNAFLKIFPFSFTIH